jgi:peptidoglycan/LPS O-acetylase OafA/YrhL
MWRFKIEYRMAARYLLTIIGRMGKQLGPLTGLRGVAAYAVLIAHAAHASIPFYQDLIYQRLSAFGMSLFFVLSGFVIYYNYAETFARKGLASAGWQFFVARFARLYPLYAISIIVAPYLSIFREAPWVLMSYLTLTQSWFNVQIAVFPPAWSISTEWFFYLAFVPLLWVVRRVPPTLRALLVYCAAAAMAAWLLLGVWGHSLAAFVQDNLFVAKNISAEPKAWLTYYGAPTRLLEFIAGMLAARAYIAGSGAPGARAVLVGAPLWCIAVIVIGPLTDGPPLVSLLPNFIFAPALAFFMVYVCLLPESWMSRALSSPSLLFMGEISYSVYVWSFFVLDAIADRFKPGAFSAEAVATSLFKIAGAVCLTTVFAYGSYRMIEMPSRRWLRNVLSGKAWATKMRAKN